MPDSCDIVSGATSPNCNISVRPDECEFPECPGIRLDGMTCDHSVTLADVPLFVEFLVAGRYLCQRDMDQSGWFDGEDIPPFVAVLVRD